MLRPVQRWEVQEAKESWQRAEKNHLIFRVPVLCHLWARGEIKQDDSTCFQHG